MRHLIDADDGPLSVPRQCCLLGLNRSSFYCEAATETAENLRLMRLRDITYAPMAAGFMYLAAIIDWYRRYVIAWRLSNRTGMTGSVHPRNGVLWSRQWGPP